MNGRQVYLVIRLTILIINCLYATIVLAQETPNTVCPCYSGPRHSGNLVIPDALSSQSHLAVADKLKFWSSRYNGNLVLHVGYSKGRL